MNSKENYLQKCLINMERNTKTTLFWPTFTNLKERWLTNLIKRTMTMLKLVKVKLRNLSRRVSF